MVQHKPWTPSLYSTVITLSWCIELLLISSGLNGKNNSGLGVRGLGHKPLCDHHPIWLLQLYLLQLSPLLSLLPPTGLTPPLNPEVLVLPSALCTSYFLCLEHTSFRYSRFCSNITFSMRPTLITLIEITIRLHSPYFTHPLPYSITF